MSHTYCQLLYHVVFSTKHRHPWITGEIEERLYPYIAGIVQKEKSTLLTIGGMPDHLHLFVRWRTDVSVADLLRTIKANSSGWIHKTWSTHQDFAWQEGYGAFTVSVSQETKVRNYIQRQQEHHKKHTFKDEFVRLLEQHQVEYDPRYIWK